MSDCGNIVSVPMDFLEFNANMNWKFVPGAVMSACMGASVYPSRKLLLLRIKIVKHTSAIAITDLMPSKNMPANSVNTLPPISVPKMDDPESARPISLFVSTMEDARPRSMIHNREYDIVVLYCTVLYLYGIVCCVLIVHCIISIIMMMMMMMSST